MSDELPEYLKLKVYKKLLSQVTQSKESPQALREDPETLVHSKLTDDRAVELMEKLKAKYPEVYRVLVNELYKAIKSGALTSIDGYTLYTIFNSLGLDIKPEIRLKFVKHGKEVDVKDYLG